MEKSVEWRRPDPGRYVGHGNGRFTVECANCGALSDFTTGAGTAYLPTLLRRANWKMHGRSRNAFWVCPDCPLPSPPETPANG